MIEILDKGKCCGCHGCTNICPKSCISMETDQEGFWYPKVDKNLCIDCHLCEKVCPILENPLKEEFIPAAYACKNKVHKVRENSSSGGVFSLLCEEVISNGGVVFGASFDENFEVRHIYAETLEDCVQFRGSKYVQSKIGETYKQARKFLNDGRLVLFSGTQCQIKGLNLYLRKKYDNLIAVDIICHGVPSPKVFREYRQNLENSYHSKINNIWFRRKDEGWKKFSFAVSFENGKEYVKNLQEDTFMRGFLSDLYLRPSCYECTAKNFVNNADITLADYWGVQHIHPEFDDDRGISLILVNSKKGQHYLSLIEDKMNIIETDIEYAIKHNPSAIRPVHKNPRRDKFFNMFNTGAVLNTAIKKCIKPTLMQRVKGKVYRVLSKGKRLVKKILINQ